MSDEQRPLVRGVRMAVRGDANAFGYSILITVTFGMVSLAHPPVSVGRLFLFALGATLAFAVTEAATTRLFRIRLREEPSDVVVVGTAMAPLAVCGSLGVAWGLATISGPGLAWFDAPAAATVGYVVATGGQMALARRFAEEHPPDESG